MKKVLLIGLALSLFSCSKENEIDPVLEQNYYEINKDDTFDVSLISNGTTGYSWKWIKDQSVKAVDSINAIYIPKKVPEGIIGSGGNEIWKFKGKESGIYTLTFKYSRSWELNSAFETKKIIVKIN